MPKSSRARWYGVALLVQSLGIYDLLKAVRDDLKRFKDEQRNESGETGLPLASLDMELKALVEASAEGGIRLVLAKLGGKIKSGQVSTIRLTFKPTSQPALVPPSTHEPERAATTSARISMPGIKIPRITRKRPQARSMRAHART